MSTGIYVANPSITDVDLSGICVAGPSTTDFYVANLSTTDVDLSGIYVANPSTTDVAWYLCG